MHQLHNAGGANLRELLRQEASEFMRILKDADIPGGNMGRHQRDRKYSVRYGYEILTQLTQTWGHMMLV